MATDQRMYHCKRCRKATLHISQSTSHLIHLFLTILNMGVSLLSVTLLGPFVVRLWVWPVVWFAVTLWNRAQAQCRECGRNRIAALPSLGFNVVFVLAFLLATMRTSTDPQQGVATNVGEQIGTGRTASMPNPLPAPRADGGRRGEFRYGR